MVYFAHFLYDAPAAKEGFMDESFQLEICSRGEGQVRSTHVQLLVEGGTWEKKIKINAKETALLNYFSEE